MKNIRTSATEQQNITLTKPKVVADKDSIGDDRIRDVWVDNFLHELEQVAALIDQYNYISMVSFITRKDH